MPTNAFKKRRQEQIEKQNAERAAKAKESTAPGVPASSAPEPSEPVAGSSSQQAKTPEAVATLDGTSDAPTLPKRDPNTDVRDMTAAIKNLDLGTDGWSVAEPVNIGANFEPRPRDLCKLGTEAKIGLNAFDVLAIPSKKVYQYDIVVGTGNEKRGLIKKVWESKTVKEVLKNGWIFDGNRLAWSWRLQPNEITLEVNLDEEEGREVRPGGKTNKHNIQIRLTNPVHFDTLRAYVEKKTSFDNKCLEAITFLDHLLRETPSQRYTKIKRSFFDRGLQHERHDLGKAVETFPGCYASLRIAHPARLSINLDVANGTFWHARDLTTAALFLTSNDTVPLLKYELSKGPNGHAAQQLQKMHRLHVTANHRTKSQGKPTVDKYVIERFVWKDPKTLKFEKDGKQTNLYDYISRTLGVYYQHPDLPLVKMTKGEHTYIPMEFLGIPGNQRYVYKLDDAQTRAMMKHAVQPPRGRWEKVERSLRMLDWENDPVLKEYGMKISPSRTIVTGRVLPAPTVCFDKGGKIAPGTSGRWRLDGKQFLKPNPQPLRKWSVTLVPNRSRRDSHDAARVRQFMDDFVRIYKGHGGLVDNVKPPIITAQSDNIMRWVEEARTVATNQGPKNPDGTLKDISPAQILIFIFLDRDSTVYNRIKGVAECTYGVVSQCMQFANVSKCEPQYISNVLMKFNAKLGGITCRALGSNSRGMTGTMPQTIPTVLMGADVSHAAPGAQTPSMAALTMSMDTLMTRYAVGVETNGYRVEMITTENINKLMKPLLSRWMFANNNNVAPKRIIYFRDGVSEGQFAEVLCTEVKDMKALVKTAKAPHDVQFVVIVGSKRHHIRFFPQKGDNNGNAFPGTLVDSGVTHPFENDFYLCSHAAIKGTARPAHYQVLLNEAKMSNDEIQTLIYEHSYQYIRSTTPISQHPAIYYAHLAALRAMSHIDENATTGGPPQSGPRTGPAPPAGGFPAGGPQASGSRAGGAQAGRPQASGSRAGGSQAGSPGVGSKKPAGSTQLAGSAQQAGSSRAAAAQPSGPQSGGSAAAQASNEGPAAPKLKAMPNDTNINVAMWYI